MPELAVLPAAVQHIPGILIVLEKNLFKNQTVTQGELENKGFLMHAFTAEDLQAAIADKENYIVLVALDGESVVGYALGYSTKTNLELQKRLLDSATVVSPNEKIFYYRHIARMPGRKGAGKQLLSALLEEAARQNYRHVICQIAEKPLKNIISIVFHERFNFQLCGFQPDGEGTTYGVYLKSLFF